MNESVSKRTWVEDIVDAILSYGGKAHLSQIYEYIEQNTNRSEQPSWLQNTRQRIYDNAKVSSQFKGEDIFYPTRKVGDGWWGVRKEWLGRKGYRIEDQKSTAGETTNKTKKSPAKKPIPISTSLEREWISEIRLSLSRNQDVINWVKEAENCECQICGYCVVMPDGGKSIEVHHIWPLGTPHNGYELGHDRIENAISICPNHHKEMHMGLFFIEPETHKIIYHDKQNPNHGKTLRINAEHNLDDEFLAYHRDTIYSRWKG